MKLHKYLQSVYWVRHLREYLFLLVFNIIKADQIWQFGQDIPFQSMLYISQPFGGQVQQGNYTTPVHKCIDVHSTHVLMYCRVKLHAHCIIYLW